MSQGQGETHVCFPGEDFVSKAEFDRFMDAGQSRLDGRFAYEQTLVTAQAVLVRPGSCACCLRTASYTTRSGNLRDGQVCDCPRRLGQRARAMLHFLEAEAGLDAWSRLLILGPVSPLDAVLAAGRATPLHVPRLFSAGESPAGYRLDAADASCTLALSWDYLPRIPPLDAALAEVRRVLAGGGRFVFTLPFHWRAPHGVSRLTHIPRRGGRLPAEFAGEIHEIGWDILDRLRAAGFADARAHHYWSDELGYLGAANFLFAASA